MFWSGGYDNKKIILSADLVILNTIWFDMIYMILKNCFINFLFVPVKCYTKKNDATAGTLN